MPEADDDLENDVDEVIRSCGGNPRAAIRALSISNTYLSAEVDRLVAALSVTAIPEGNIGRLGSRK